MTMLEMLARIGTGVGVIMRDGLNVRGLNTAAGGAWNASIVAEVVTYHASTLTATGLGAYIAQATATGDFPRILVGVSVMSLYVVGLNRLFWRRLYRLAQQRFSY